METKPKSVKVLIVDDSEIVRAALVNLIESEPDIRICGEAADEKTALKLAQDLKPNTVILDLSLNDWKGEEVLRKLKSLSACPVLIVSMHDEITHGARTLNAGANGYLMKRDAAGQIIPAIRQVLEGRRYLSRNLASKLGGLADEYF